MTFASGRSIEVSPTRERKMVFTRLLFGRGGWVGGWVGGREGGGSNAVLWVAGGWVGGLCT